MKFVCWKIKDLNPILHQEIIKRIEQVEEIIKQEPCEAGISLND